MTLSVGTFVSPISPRALVSIMVLITRREVPDYFVRQSVGKFVCLISHLAERLSVLGALVYDPSLLVCTDVMQFTSPLILHIQTLLSS